jgi:hypothetical protein
MKIIQLKKFKILNSSFSNKYDFFFLNIENTCIIIIIEKYI